MTYRIQPMSVQFDELPIRYDDQTIGWLREGTIYAEIVWYDEPVIRLQEVEATDEDGGMIMLSETSNATERGGWKSHLWHVVKHEAIQRAENTPEYRAAIAQWRAELIRDNRMLQSEFV